MQTRENFPVSSAASLAEKRSLLGENQNLKGRSPGQRKIASSERSQEKSSGVRRSLGSQFGGRINNEDAILNNQ